MPVEVFTSFEELPEDTDIPEDGDDSIDPSSRPSRMPLQARIARPQRKVVPLPRPLERGDKGRDVTAVQRALRKAGFRKGEPTGVYSPQMANQVREFQRANGLEVDGVYGPKTHKKLAPMFDARGIWLMMHANVSSEKKERAAMVATAMLGHAKRTFIHYTQSPKRMQGVREEIHPPKVPSWEDCSSFVTWCYWVGTDGSLDPNGRDFDGFGYTGTLSQNGTRTANPEPGDLGFYGGGTYSHVVIYVGRNMCVSHGSEGGPYYTDPHYRSDFSHWRSYL